MGRLLSLKSGQQTGPPVQVAGLFHGNTQGFLLADEDDPLASPRKPGVEEVALEHHKMLHGQGDDDGGKFAALAFVDGNGVGEAEFV